MMENNKLNQWYLQLSRKIHQYRSKNIYFKKRWLPYFKKQTIQSTYNFSVHYNKSTSILSASIILMINILSFDLVIISMNNLDILSSKSWFYEGFNFFNYYPLIFSTIFLFNIFEKIIIYITLGNFIGGFLSYLLYRDMGKKGPLYSVYLLATFILYYLLINLSGNLNTDETNIDLFRFYSQTIMRSINLFMTIAIPQLVISTIGFKFAKFINKRFYYEKN